MLEICRQPEETGEDDIYEQADSIAELLQLRARLHPERQAFAFLDDKGNRRTLSYGELDARAAIVAARLSALNKRGERVVLLYPPGLDFIAGFFGCLYAGVVAVPAYPPTHARHLPRLRNVIEDCGASLLLAERAVKAKAEALSGETQDTFGLSWLLTDDDSIVQPNDRLSLISAPTGLAFLQYTSGSTGHAKGVMVSHGNLMANQRLIKDKFGHTRHSNVVGWLPLYHDMGLIGNVMQPIYLGASALLMAPMTFLAKPVRWLEAISEFRAHTSGGPNFAYDLCARKITAEDKQGLDLSSWQLAFNGAEPVNPATLERFAAAFGDCGFNREAFYPCYGLAEATLFVTGADKNREPTVRYFDKKLLEQKQARRLDTLAETGRGLVGCGKVGEDASHRVRIVKADSGAVCPEGIIGEIEVGGPSVAAGYWQDEEATARTFTDDGSMVGRWLRTGDLGFIDGGELFVSGRLKDLIIVRGRNYYPQDLEYATESASDAMNPGGIAAFSDDGADGECLIVLAELQRNRLRQGDYRVEFAAIRGRLVEECGIEAENIVLLKPGALPKTSSGKIRRSACRDAYRQGLFDAVASDRNADDGVTVTGPGSQTADIQTNDRLLRLTLPTLPEHEGALMLACRLGEKVTALTGGVFETVDLEQPILSLGIDSLKAVELKYFIDDLLGIELPVCFFLDNYSIKDCAEQALQLARARESGNPAAHDSPRANEFLSFGQQALWTGTKVETGNPVYNMAVAVRIASAVDRDRLQFALQNLSERHRSLRTVFRRDDNGEPVRVLAPNLDIAVEIVVCADTQTCDRHLVEALRKPFGLERGPLLRAVLFRLHEREHRLLLCAHHSIVDFRSMVVLLDELRYFYDSALEWSPSALPALNGDYGNFVAWQRAYMESERAERDLAYWQRQLADAPARLELPTDRPRPAEPAYRGATETLLLSQENLAGLKRLAVHQQTTLYTVLLALFKTLLYRYSGNQDLIVGSPTLGRPQAAFARTVGYFVNPVALRSRPQPDKPFVDYLGEVKKTVLEALAHQDYPFSRLVEKLSPERRPGLSPFYRTWFVLQEDSADSNAAALALNLGGYDLQWPSLKAETFALAENIAQFDLTLMAAELGHELAVAFQYNAELFDEATVRRMSGHFRSLVRGILAAPSARLSELPLLKTAEQRQLALWNATAAAYPKNTCVHALFEAQAAKTPAAEAVAYRSRGLSYRELNDRANRLAHYLIAQGAGPEVRIAVCIERCLELPVALLAVLKAGAVYVPIDPSYPKERQAYVLQNAGISLVLTHSQCIAELAAESMPVLCVDDESALRRYSQRNPDVRLHTENAAYVIYTSGSTGQPKGVAVSHRNVAHSTWSRQNYYRDTVGRYLLLSSFAFDSSVAGLFWTLSQGGCLVLPEDAHVKDPVQLGALIRDRQVTHLLALPALYEAVLENAAPDALDSLNTAIVAGEACADKVAERHFERLPNTRLFNEYGPTEVTVWSTVAEVLPTHPITIGKPIANVRAYITDRTLQPVPVGVVGELVIGGAGVAHGYLGRPEASAETFVPDPFGQAGERIYKTGDLARYRSDGNIEFVGRNDHQVKLRGFRIELGEIEACLTTCPGIAAAVVALREDIPGNPRLVAYVVAEASQSPDVDTVKARLKQALPEYMVPAAYVTLDALPLNANGKTDRSKLPAPDIEVIRNEAYQAPRDEAEAAVAEVWREILGVERIGIHDDFFDLGGHSLAGVQVTAKIQELFGIDVPVNVLFEAPTVAQFVDRVAAYQEE